MTNENVNSPNSIKYSIWQTRTEGVDPRVKERLTRSGAGTNQERKPGE